MSQSDSEQQLRIWKDLAIGKQVLMNEAASVLKLADDFTADDLREALNHAVKRARDADADIAAAQNRASDEIAAMQATVKQTEKQRRNAETERDEARAAAEAAEAALATGRADNAEAIKKARRDVEAKSKELKAINTALADTPENTVKKLKQLKKQKLDEANARKVAEEAMRKLKKENKEHRDELDELTALRTEAASLLAAYRELATWADEAAAKGEGLDAAPKADAKLLSSIETTTAAADEADDDKDGKTSKKKGRDKQASASAAPA